MRRFCSVKAKCWVRRMQSNILYTSVVQVTRCFVTEVESERVGSKMVVNRVIMSCDLVWPRKSVRKKYSEEALSMSVWL